MIKIGLVGCIVGVFRRIKKTLGLKPKTPETEKQTLFKLLVIQMLPKVLPLAVALIFYPMGSASYPIFAQQVYENPRESTGQIVCANCHLAQKSIGIEVPKAVVPDQFFEAVVSIPYNLSLKQVAINGKNVPLNVGAVLILPENFKLAPKDLISNETKKRTKGVFVQPYSKTKSNILVVGPISGNSHQEIVFPLVAPDPSKNLNTHFLTYPIYVGANRGRGQVYPNGEKSNNTIFTAASSGQIRSIKSFLNKGKMSITLQKLSGRTLTQTVPKGVPIIVNPYDVVTLDQFLTVDPNVGGFGQMETEIVLQNPNRVKGMIIFFILIIITQIFLILKKKQFEKVQLAEINF